MAAKPRYPRLSAFKTAEALRAHVQGLGRIGLLSDAEVSAVEGALSDLAAAFAYFNQYGVTMERAYEPGAPSFIIRDPDGLIIEIIGQLP